MSGPPPLPKRNTNPFSQENNSGTVNNGNPFKPLTVEKVHSPPLPKRNQNEGPGNLPPIPKRNSGLDHQGNQNDIQTQKPLPKNPPQLPDQPTMSKPLPKNPNNPPQLPEQPRTSKPLPNNPPQLPNQPPIDKPLPNNPPQLPEQPRTSKPLPKNPPQLPNQPVSKPLPKNPSQPMSKPLPNNPSQPEQKSLPQLPQRTVNTQNAPPRLPNRNHSSQDLSVQSTPPLPSRNSGPRLPSRDSQPHNTEVYNSYQNYRQDDSEHQYSVQGSDGETLVSQNPDGSWDTQNLQDRTQKHVQKESGKAVGNMAENEQNQEKFGNYVADKSDNKMVGTLAKNKFVQQQSGKAVSKAANDEENQQKVGDFTVAQSKKQATNAKNTDKEKFKKFF